MKTLRVARTSDLSTLRACAMSVSMVALSCALIAACTPSAGGSDRDVAAPVPAGAVSSAHPLATDAGIAVLEEGGNAFDAAVAVAAVLTVVEPQNSNLFGGYGTLVVYDAESGETRYLDNNGRFPQATDSDVFRAAGDRAEIMRTAQAVSTPGNLHGFEALWQEHGSLTWQRLLEPAIRHSEEGVAVSAPLARAIDGAWKWMSPYTRGFYGTDGEPLEEGDLLIQADLGSSLRLAAERGAAALTEGPIADALEREMERQGGFLALSDIEQHRAEWLEPVSIEYRGRAVTTAGPPSNSFASLVCLGIMSRFEPASLGHNTGDYLHHFAEATKHAFWARLAYAGGPEVNPPPLGRILGEAYWQQQADAVGATASVFSPPGPRAPESESTTHFVTADASGNVVSATITLGHGFGSAVMVEEAGIWLNNSMAYSTYEPKGNPMDALPGARKHSSKTPTIIFEEGRPWVAIGTPGGHTIPQTTPQMVINLIDFGMSVADAVAAARVSFAEPNRLLVEESIDGSVRDDLAARGHEIETVSGIGLAHGLLVRYGEGGSVVGFEGGADPRGVGTFRLAEAR